MNIDFNITLWNIENFRPLFSRTWSALRPHKYFEIEGFYTHPLDLVGFEFSTREGDHRGWNVFFNLLGLTLGFTYYDSRHKDAAD